LLVETIVANFGGLDSVATMAVPILTVSALYIQIILGFLSSFSGLHATRNWYSFKI